jgi:hypothetical protein
MRKALRYTLITLLLLLLLAAAVGFAVYRAAQRVPAFYAEELSIAPQAQEKESDLMLQQAASLHADLHRRGRWQQALEAKTINAWLAVDLPKNFPDLLPPSIRDPRVHIAPEGITLACRLDRYGMHGVVSLQVSAFVESDDVIGLRIHKARLGALPWSLNRVLQVISDAARQANVRIQWRQIDGDPVALITLTPANGDRKHVVHIDTIRLEEGQLLVAGTTEPAK